MNNFKTAILGTAAIAMLAACATPQSNPHYKYSSKMPATDGYSTAPQQAPVTYQAAHTAGSYNEPAHTQAASYSQPASYTSADARQACLAKEQSRKLIGAAIGGTVGSFAGKKLGGDDNETLGLVGGAALGGAAGYGVGNMSVDCPQVSAPVSAPIAGSYPAAQSYTAVPAPVIPAQSQTVTQVERYAEPVMVETGGQNAAQIGNYSYNSAGYVTDAAITAPAAQTTQRLYDIPAAAVLPAQAPAAPRGTTYIIQEGDTAWSLSRKTCSGVNDIKAINNLEGDFLIKAGEAILLPASAC